MVWALRGIRTPEVPFSTQPFCVVFIKQTPHTRHAHYVRDFAKCTLRKLALQVATLPVPKLKLALLSDSISHIIIGLDGPKLSGHMVVPLARWAPVRRLWPSLSGVLRVGCRLLPC